jgi:hypothetical protein
MVQTTEKTFVDRVRDGVVEQVTVQRAASEADNIEVFGALAAGDVGIAPRIGGAMARRPRTHPALSPHPCGRAVG